MPQRYSFDSTSRIFYAGDPLFWLYKCSSVVICAAVGLWERYSDGLMGPARELGDTRRLR